MVREMAGRLWPLSWAHARARREMKLRANFSAARASVAPSRSLRKNWPKPPGSPPLKRQRTSARLLSSWGREFTTSPARSMSCAVDLNASNPWCGRGVSALLPGCAFASTAGWLGVERRRWTTVSAMSSNIASYSLALMLAGTCRIVPASNPSAGAAIDVHKEKNAAAAVRTTKPIRLLRTSRLGILPNHYQQRPLISMESPVFATLRLSARTNSRLPKLSDWPYRNRSSPPPTS